MRRKTYFIFFINECTSGWWSLWVNGTKWIDWTVFTGLALVYHTLPSLPYRSRTQSSLVFPSCRKTFFGYSYKLTTQLFVDLYRTHRYGAGSFIKTWPPMSVWFWNYDHNEKQFPCKLFKNVLIVNKHCLH